MFVLSEVISHFKCSACHMVASASALKLLDLGSSHASDCERVERRKRDLIEMNGHGL